jgi:steroid 5-alpha reductase family enzyme
MHFYIFGHIWLAAFFLMFFGWVVSLLRKRAEIVDVLCTIGTALAGIWCSIVLEGDTARRMVLGGVFGLWGLRLSLHLFKDRFLATYEDGRYKDLREEWGNSANSKFFLFFQLQAFLIPVLATTAFSVASNSRPLSWIDSIAIIIMLLSILGETVSDRQLARFKIERKNNSDPANSICRVGLWNWSRHPNYFFEWTFWLTFPVLALGSPYFFLVFISPVLMFYLIRYVTGVPPTEDRMLKSRGDIFLKYQAEVSAFIPLPPKVKN